jgi:RHS repeat-associated protein
MTAPSNNQLYLHVITGTFIQLSSPDLKVDYYTAEIVKSTEYSCYGVELSGWGYLSVDSYRYGFNGKELDVDGMGGGGSTYDYGFRIYNPALGKFLSVDPLRDKFPMLTPYQFASNTPIQSIDLDGLEAVNYLEVAKLLKDQKITTELDVNWGLFRIIYNHQGVIVTVETYMHGADNTDLSDVFNDEYAAERFNYWGNHKIWAEVGRDFVLRIDSKYDTGKDHSPKYDNGGIFNSFHHMVGIAVITATIGIDFAKYAGDAHERNGGVLILSPDNYRDDAIADLINNKFAREIAISWKKSIGGDPSKVTNEQVAELLNMIAYYVMEASPAFKNEDGTFPLPNFQATDQIVSRVRETIIDLND